MIVRWNQKAVMQWEEMTAYIVVQFGPKAVIDFNRNLVRWQRLLAQNPLIGNQELLITGRRYEYRSIVIHRHCKLVYYIKPTGEIRVAALWDTRREPGKLSTEI